MNNQHYTSNLHARMAIVPFIQCGSCIIHHFPHISFLYTGVTLLQTVEEAALSLYLNLVYASVGVIPIPEL